MRRHLIRGIKTVTHADCGGRLGKGIGVALVNPLSLTKNRVGATHTWPALRDLPTTETAAVAGGSTSSQTMTGA